jgi:hypothetical protein
MKLIYLLQTIMLEDVLKKEIVLDIKPLYLKTVENKSACKVDRPEKLVFACKCLFVWIFTARQHITGHIVPNAIIGLKYYVKHCK